MVQCLQLISHSQYCKVKIMYKYTENPVMWYTCKFFFGVFNLLDDGLSNECHAMS